MWWRYLLAIKYIENRFFNFRFGLLVYSHIKSEKDLNELKNKILQIKFDFK